MIFLTEITICKAGCIHKKMMRRYEYVIDYVTLDRKTLQGVNNRDSTKDMIMITG